MKSTRKRTKRNRKKGTANKKKRIIIVVCVVVILGCGAAGFFANRLLGGSDEVVPVSSVASIMGIGSGSGSQNRYAGVIESQKKWTAKKDSSRNIKKVYVEEGDEVKIGDKLFKYDESSMEEQLAQAKIELQQYDIDIADLKSQVKELEKEKATAASSDKLSYTLQIQSAQNDIKKNEYEKEQKQKEITKMEKSKGDTTVVSELAGVVTKVNSYTNSDGDTEDTESGDSGSDSSEDLITITGVGNYRVKCKINEQNYSDITEGDTMLVHSRVDEELVWKGTISSVDTGNEAENDSEEEDVDMDMEGSEDDMTSSSSYTFYVDLDSSDNLLLGQHVYVEPDNGQSAQKEGVWLDEAYICDVDGDAYVWADNGKGRLMKKTVVLGEYDEELFQYEITAGLTLEDKVSYPGDSYKEGMKTEEEVYNDAGEDDDSEDFEEEDGSFEDSADDEEFSEESYEEDFSDGLEEGLESTGDFEVDGGEGE